MPVSIEDKIDYLIGIVRVVADDQVTIRTKLAIIEANVAALDAKLDAYLTDQAAQKIRKLTPPPAPRIVPPDDDKEGA